MLDTLISLLGRRDHPTDAVEDYCAELARGLATLSASLHVARMPWAKIGWTRAYRWLWKESAQWRGRWVLVQYTALSWSRRGFPIGFLLVTWILKRRGARVAVVFHDTSPFDGSRLRDRVRRVVQVAVMRWTARRADKLISLCPSEHLSWVRDRSILAKVAYIPVGSMVRSQLQQPAREQNGIPTVVVFGVTENRREEAALIAQVIQRTREAVGRLRLVVVGRGALQAEPTLRQCLEGSGVTLQVEGVLPAEQVSDFLVASHAQLFVRTSISSRRSSAIAGICSGIAVVGYADKDTDFPVTEAGVRFAPKGDADGLARELVNVLKDQTLWRALCERSREAARKYFCWEVIGRQFMEVLK